MQEIQDIKLYARKNDVPIVKDDTQNFICNYIKEHKYTKILEIGTAIGYSAILFAKAALENCGDIGERYKTEQFVNVTSIEIDIDRHIKAKQNVCDCGLENQINLIYQDALDTQLTEKFDLIFIDAAKAQYTKFFEKYKNNLAENGVIISDNLKFHGMVEDLSLTHNESTIRLVKKIRKYVEFLKQNQEFQTEFFDIGDGISVSKRV